MMMLQNNHITDGLGDKSTLDAQGTYTVNPFMEDNTAV